jgi:hypothetical protein
LNLVTNAKSFLTTFCLEYKVVGLGCELITSCAILITRSVSFWTCEFFSMKISISSKAFYDHFKVYVLKLKDTSKAGAYLSMWPTEDLNPNLISITKHPKLWLWWLRTPKNSSRNEQHINGRITSVQQKKMTLALISNPQSFYIIIVFRQRSQGSKYLHCRRDKMIFFTLTWKIDSCSRVSFKLRKSSRLYLLMYSIVRG